jgi:hypothetical protein
VFVKNELLLRDLYVACCSNGENRLTVQRRQFWKGRFAEFSSMNGVGEECPDSAGEADLSMAKVGKRYHAA